MTREFDKSSLRYREIACRLIREGQTYLRRDRILPAQTNFALAWGYSRHIEDVDLMGICSELMQSAGVPRKDINQTQNSGYDLVLSNLAENSRGAK